VARHGDFTMDNLKLQLERAFEKIRLSGILRGTRL
jgi:hypothetical protein